MTYVYRCPECKAKKELEQSIADPFRPTCPCLYERPATMERVLFPGAFILKGGGWAKDGYG